MDSNTGYIITNTNAQLLSYISGLGYGTIFANKGWAAVFEEAPYPRWLLMPTNVAEARKGFRYVDSELNGLPARKEEVIRKEWAEVNKTYSVKVDELSAELERAKLTEEPTND